MKKINEEMSKLIILVFRPMVKKMIDVLEWFGDLNESTQKAIVIVVFLSTISIPIIIILGSIAAIANALNFTVSPIIVDIAIVLILIATSVYLWKD